MPILTSFRPQNDGFSFTNGWDLSQDTDTRDQIRNAFLAAEPNVKGVLEDILGTAIDMLALINSVLPSVGAWLTGGSPASYGMCGGMGFTILDYWTLGWLPPQGNGMPPGWTPADQAVLRGYIRNRLADSLGIGGVAVTTLAWMVVQNLIPATFGGGAKKLRDMTQAEFAKVKNSINAGHPVPIALVGTTTSPFNQHQIVVYGYDDPGNGMPTLFVYDYNCGNGQSTISLDFRASTHVLVGTNSGESCFQADRGQLCGFFVPAYTPKTPPIALGLTQFSVASGPTVTMDDQITIQFTAMNAGFGATLPIELYVAGRAGAGNAINVDAGGEQTFAGIAEGGSRVWSTTVKIGPPAGPRVYSASAYVGWQQGVNCWKALPSLGSAPGTITVNVADYPGWQSLGGVLTSQVSVVQDAGGQLHVFGTGTRNEVWHQFNSSVSGWSGWSDFATKANGQPVAACNSDGRMEIFIRGMDNALWHRYQLTPDTTASGNWSDWESLGGKVENTPVVGVNSNGGLEVFVMDENLQISHIWQVPGGWSSWQELQIGPGQILSVVTNHQGRLELYGLWQGNVQRAVQPAPGGSWPTAWTTIPGTIGSNPVAAINADGRVEIFATATGAGGVTLLHNYQQTAGGAWSGWSSLGGSLSSLYVNDDLLSGYPAVIRDQRGLLNVFVWSTLGEVAWIAQSSGGGWTAWQDLGGPLEFSPFAAMNRDGRLELFIWAHNNALYHRWQTSPNGPWSS